MQPNHQGDLGTFSLRPQDGALALFMFSSGVMNICNMDSYRQLQPLPLHILVK